mmetsp:Transcript_33745/g.77868  ORF Transcript_33745/g.77868 Transcript_33745/m.77868 type:complete len:81 (-) Transcript_33745:284-526(-)
MGCQGSRLCRKKAPVKEPPRFLSASKNNLLLPRPAPKERQEEPAEKKKHSPLYVKEETGSQPDSKHALPHKVVILESRGG